MEPKFLEREREKSKKTKANCELGRKEPKPVLNSNGNEVCGPKRASWQVPRNFRSARADPKLLERFNTETDSIFSP